MIIIKICLLMLVQSFSSRRTNFILLKDILFSIQYYFRDINISLCPQMPENFHYRGKPKFIEEILNNEQTKINSTKNDNLKFKDYPLVYIKDNKYFEYVKYFSESTYFLLDNIYGIKIDSNNSVCILISNPSPSSSLKTLSKSS